MKFGILVFPGSNCDVDCYHVLENVLEQDVSYIWHEDSKKGEFDCLVLPGGFSYGDYLRCGALAQFSRAMDLVKESAAAGKVVLGICNGFQILTEAQLLPGALVRNRGMKFLCKDVIIKVATNQSPVTARYAKDATIRIPISHGEGNYVADEETLRELAENDQILFTYEDNPNGSLKDIAGICNKERNVIGLMPHPERACEEALGNLDGLVFFQSLIQFLKRG